MHMRKKKRTIFSSIFVSYLILTGVLILLNLVGYFQSLTAYRKETEMVQSLQLEDNGQSIDNVVQKAYELSDTIQKSKVFTENLSLPSECTAEQLLKVIDLQSYLSNHPGMEMVWDRIDIYFPVSNAVVSTEYHRFAGDLLPLYCVYQGMSEVAFFDMLESCENWDCILPGEDPGNISVIFVRKIFNVHRELQGVILIHVPEKTVQSLLMEGNYDSAEIGFISDSQGKVLYTSNEKLELAATAPDAGENRLGMDEYVTICCQSKLMDWEYGFCIPKKTFSHKISVFAGIIVVEIIACVVAGCILTLFLSKKTYDPIASVLTAVQSARKRATGTETHTYESLENSLRELKNNMISLQIREKQEREESSYQLLGSIFSGKLRNTDIIEGLFREIETRTGKLLMQDQDYFLVIEWITINLEKTVLSKETEPGDLFFFVFRNVLGECFSEYLSMLPARVGQRIFCLIQIEDQEMPANFTERLQTVSQFLKQSFDLETLTAISAVHSGYNNIALACEEAEDVLVWKRFWREENREEMQIICYDQIARQEGGTQDYCSYLEELHKFINYLETKDLEAAREKMDSICEMAFSKDIRDNKGNRYQLLALIGVLLGFAEKTENVNTTEYTHLAQLEQVLGTCSLYEFREMAYVLLEDLWQNQQIQTDANEPEWISEIKAYIAKNYKDENLSVSFVADQFGLSVSHLSRVFKLHTGSNVLKYIQQIRLQEAKRLLAQGMNVQTVAEQTGYGNIRTLIRLFKKHEGITPSQYREYAEKL